MSNTFVNPTVVAKEALRQLKNNCVMGNLAFRGYESEWDKSPNGYKIGSSVTVKAPVYFRVKDGATLDAVDLVERSTSFTISYRKHVAWVCTSQEMTLNIDKFSQRFIQPAMQALANFIDVTMLGLYKGIPNQVGTPGTTPSDFYTFAQAGARLDEEACPQENRHCVIDPQAQAKLADHLKGLFNNSMVGDAVTKAKIGDIAGFNMYKSQNVNTHTCGTWAGSAAVLMDATNNQGDATIAVDQNGAGSALTVKQGDIFTIGSVNSVNPISGQSTGSLRQFVADADNTFADAGGGDFQIAALTCTPGTAPYQLYSSAAAEAYLPYQNVDALPQNNAAVAIAGSSALQHKANLSFHRDCLGLVMAPLEMPASAVWKAQESHEGFRIRVIRDYDITNDQEYIRFDVLFGVKVLNPNLGCRIAG